MTKKTGPGPLCQEMVIPNNRFGRRGIMEELNPEIANRTYAPAVSVQFDISGFRISNSGFVRFQIPL
jgi:hypothetical protein